MASSAAPLLHVLVSGPPAADAPAPTADAPAALRLPRTAPPASTRAALAALRSALAAAGHPAAAGLPPHPPTTLRLYAAAAPDTIVAAGPSFPTASESAPLRIVASLAKNTADSAALPSPSSVIESVRAIKSIVADSEDLKKSVLAVKFKIDQIERYTAGSKDKHVTKPASRRAARVLQNIQFPVSPNNLTFSDAIYEQLKTTSFDIWLFNESELVHFIAHMFVEFDFINTFNIDTQTLHNFLNVIKNTYNRNPFHNFQHCFCVTQMMYALLHTTGIHTKLTSLEKFSLILAAIGHDLDHPGFNNAYQINAFTELAITYNDVSPLENHHCAVLFSILQEPSTNILAGLSLADYKEVRKVVIMCILATDMAKHGEILAKFKSFSDAFSYEDPNQRYSLFQILIKCSDISNEARPKHVSEPWVDNLLEEFFTQSDKEKAEGLPTAPFMDRDKVTKPSAQVGFIGFVMIPLYELASKVLPNMEEPVIQPIRKALEYYKGLMEKKT